MKKFKYTLLTSLLSPICLLPLSWSQALGAQLGRLLIRINQKRRRVAQVNLKACFPEKDHDELQSLIDKNARETGKWFLESPYVWFKNTDYLIDKSHIQNPELLEELYAEGKGVVIVAPHFGNWEMLNFYIAKHYPFSIMYRPIKSELMEKLVVDSRTRIGSGLFKVDSQGVRQAFKHLKAGKVLGILPDHLPTRKAGVYAPFFGLPALTGKFTHSLIKHNQSNVIIATAIREAKGTGFKIEFERIEGMHTDDPVAAATAMNAAIERAILKSPEQYQWVYKRFASPPDGQATIYSTSHP